MQSIPGSAQNDRTSLFFFSNVFLPLYDANILHVVERAGPSLAYNLLFWLSRAVPDAMVMVVGISCWIHVIRSGFMHEMFVSNF
jgi:hypothetical protein